MVEAKQPVFKEKAGQPLNALFSALNVAMVNPNGFREPESYESQKQVMSATDAAEYLARSKKITILTGAGLSAASGIPTFRG